MKVAAVDIGTNTVRLLIADVRPAGRVEWLTRRAHVTRLGEGVDASRRLSPAAMQRTVAVLEEFREAINAADVEAARAVATSATRDASNRDLFVAAAHAALGIRPDVIGGDEEATLAFAGALAGTTGPGPHLVVDIGGGSTEFVFGDAVPGYVASVDVGSVRVTERWLPERPAPRASVDAARAEVGRRLATVDLSGEPGTVIGVAGTYTTLAAMHLGLDRYDPALVHGSRLTSSDLEALVHRLAALTVEETAAIPAVEPARAEVLLGGAVVAAVAAERLAAPITVSESDLLDGIALALAM